MAEHVDSSEPSTDDAGFDFPERLEAAFQGTIDFLTKLLRCFFHFLILPWRATVIVPRERGFPQPLTMLGVALLFYALLGIGGSKTQVTPVWHRLLVRAPEITFTSVLAYTVLPVLCVVVAARMVEDLLAFTRRQDERSRETRDAVVYAAATQVLWMSGATVALDILTTSTEVGKAAWRALGDMGRFLLVGLIILGIPMLVFTVAVASAAIRGVIRRGPVVWAGVIVVAATFSFVCLAVPILAVPLVADAIEGTTAPLSASRLTSCSTMLFAESDAEVTCRVANPSDRTIVIDRHDMRIQGRLVIPADGEWVLDAACIPNDEAGELPIASGSVGEITCRFDHIIGALVLPRVSDESSSAEAASAELSLCLATIQLSDGSRFHRETNTLRTAAHSVPAVSIRATSRAQ